MEEIRKKIYFINKKEEERFLNKNKDMISHLIKNNCTSKEIINYLEKNGSLKELKYRQEKIWLKKDTIFFLCAVLIRLSPYIIKDISTLLSQGRFLDSFSQMEDIFGGAIGYIFNIFLIVICLCYILNKIFLKWRFFIYEIFLNAFMIAPIYCTYLTYMNTGYLLAKTSYYISPGFQDIKYVFLLITSIIYILIRIGILILFKRNKNFTSRKNDI